MGRDFFDADPRRARLFALHLGALRPGPASASSSKARRRRCGENLAAQASVYLVSTLASRELSGSRGVEPAATAGYSLGNYAAMVAAGAISYEEALDVLVAVWRETERLGIRGAMGAVIGARREAVEAECAAPARARARGLDRQRQRVDAVRPDGHRPRASAAALEALGPRALSVLPLTDELADPQRAHASGRRRHRADDRRALRPIRDPDVPYYGPEGRAVDGGEEVRRLLGTAFCFPTLWKDTFEAHDGGRPSPLPRGRAGRHALEDGAVDRSVHPRHSGGHRSPAIAAAVDIVAAG